MPIIRSFLTGAVSGHYLFNLPSYTKEKLIKKGIRNISDDEIDTYENKEKFLSYRRSTNLKEVDEGRNISVIQIQDY